jgi:putative transposase
MTSDAVTTGASKKKAGSPATAQERLAAEMVAQAQEQGLALTGPDGLLKQLTKTVLETALGAEMTDHLG